MKKIINNMTRCVLIAFISLTLAVSCTDPYEPIDFAKLEAEEMALLDEFLELNLADMVAMAIDTIHVNPRGLIYFEMKTGTGDSIRSGDIVGFRYTYHAIDRDKDNKPVLTEIGSNLTAESPFLYIAGTPSAPAYTGIDEGIRYMRQFGKSKMIVPSNIGSNNFFTIVAEIEITYIDNR